MRCLKKLSLWEISIVGEPANTDAKITEVKNNPTKFYTVTELQNIVTKRDYERLLRDSGVFSKEAAVFLASKFIEKARSESAKLEVKEVPTHNLTRLTELKTLLNQL